MRRVICPEEDFASILLNSSHYFKTLPAPWMLHSMLYIFIWAKDMTNPLKLRNAQCNAMVQQWRGTIWYMQGSHLLPARSPGAVACKLVGPQAAKLPPHFESRLNNDILLPLTRPSPPPVFFFLGMGMCYSFASVTLVAVFLFILYSSEVT